MQTYNIHDAKTQLSRLVEQAAQGDSFIIAKAGKPMVKVIALNAPEPAQIKRFGFMAGQTMCQMILTRWVKKKSFRYLKKVHETTHRYPFATVGSRRL